MGAPLACSTFFARRGGPTTRLAQKVHPTRRPRRSAPDLLPEADLPEVGSEAVAELSVAMRPRYHFVATEGQWYQRPPHRQGARCAHVCRLLAMAKVQEDKKQKCVLAR